MTIGSIHGSFDGTLPGYDAGPGYDLATGLGSPIANTLVPDLAGGATVTGQILVDGEPDPAVTAGQEVYLDLGDLGTQNPNDPVATADSAGDYTFSDVVGGATGTVRLVNPLTDLAAAGATSCTTAYGSVSTGVDMNLTGIPTLVSDNANGDVYTLRVSPTDPSETELLLNGDLAYSAPSSSVTYIKFNFGGLNDELVVDNTYGSPVPPLWGSIEVDGAGAGSGDGFEMVCGPEADLYTEYYLPGDYGSPSGFEVQCLPVSDTSMIGPGYPNVHVFGVPNLAYAFAPGGQPTSFGLYGAATVTVPAQTAGGGVRSLSIGDLEIDAGAELRFASAGTYADRTVVSFNGSIDIESGATLDLGANDAIIPEASSGTFDYIESLVTSGYAGGAWDGTGITSSAAASDLLTALGVILNSVNGTPTGTAIYTAFDAVPVTAADILIKFTLLGDTDLSGLVDATDLGNLATNFGSDGATWAEGDFNYDDLVNVQDLGDLAGDFGKAMGVAIID